MDETRFPPRPHVYDRLRNLEVENPQIMPTGTTEEFRQFCYDFCHQMEIACQMIDWDRAIMTAFATVAILLIMFTFMPYLQNQMTAEEQSRHKFLLGSLTISEFQAGPDQVTGRCNARFNISNRGDRSVYHEMSVLSIFLDQELLWVARTGNFVIDNGSSILFDVDINKTTVPVPDSFAATVFKKSLMLHKPLPFTLRYDGMLREGLTTWSEKRLHAYVVCGWIEMWFSDETTLKGGPANCTIQN